AAEVVCDDVFLRAHDLREATGALVLGRGCLDQHYAGGGSHYVCPLDVERRFLRPADPGVGWPEPRNPPGRMNDHQRPGWPELECPIKHGQVVPYGRRSEAVDDHDRLALARDSGTEQWADEVRGPDLRRRVAARRPSGRPRTHDAHLREDRH